MRILLDTNLLVYLNAATSDATLRTYRSFYNGLVSSNHCFVNPLILDELLYVSYWKYRVPYSKSHSFISDYILPAVEVAAIGLPEFRLVSDLQQKYNLKPSDSLHIASMMNTGCRVIASEDRDFDRIPEVERLWLPEAR